MHFRWKNMQKLFRISCKWKILENYPLVTLCYGSFKAGDLTCSPFLWCACATLCSKIWSQYSISFWHMTRICHYHVILCPFRGVESVSISEWSVFITGWAVQLHAIFMCSFSQYYNHAGCAVIGSVNWTVPWLTPK